MAKIITHRPVHVSLPRDVYFAVMLEAERAHCSLGNVILGMIPPERLEQLMRRCPGDHEDDRESLSA